MATEKKDKVIISRYAPLTRYQTNSDNKKQSLTWTSRNGMPRCTIYLDTDNMVLPNGKLNYSTILTARFTPEELLVAIKKWRILIAKGEQKYKDVECLYPEMVDGKPVGNKKVISAIIRCGIDANKLCYFYIKEPDKPEIKFNFEVNKESRNVWHVHKDDNGMDDDIHAVGRERFITYLDTLEIVVKKEIEDSVVKVELGPKKEVPVTYSNSSTTSNSSIQIDDGLGDLI